MENIQRRAAAPFGHDKTRDESLIYSEILKQEKYQKLKKRRI